MHMQSIQYYMYAKTVTFTQNMQQSHMKTISPGSINVDWNVSIAFFRIRAAFGLVKFRNMS